MTTATAQVVMLRALVVVLFAVGVLLGIIGSFLVPLRLPGGIEGLAIVVGFAATAVCGLLGGWGLDRVMGAVLPGAGWFVGVALVNLYLPGGDVVIPGSLQNDPGVVRVGIGYLVAGVAGTVIAATLTARAVNRRLHSRERPADIT